MGQVNLEEREREKCPDRLRKLLENEICFWSVQKEEKKKHRIDQINHPLQFGPELSLNSVLFNENNLLDKFLDFRISFSPLRTFIASNVEANI